MPWPKGKPRPDGFNENRRKIPKLSTGSTTCEDCGASVPATSAGKPIQHFDARVLGAHELKIYCKKR